jgi:hypothetical protein
MFSSPNIKLFNSLTQPRVSLDMFVCDRKNEVSGWINEEYLDETVSRHLLKKQQQLYVKHHVNNDMIVKEQDLRRKLLFKFGKYELEDGEIFE